MKKILKTSLLLMLLAISPKSFSGDGRGGGAGDKDEATRVGNAYNVFEVIRYPGGGMSIKRFGSLNEMIDARGLGIFCSGSECDFTNGLTYSLKLSDSNLKALSRYRKINLTNNEITAGDISYLRKLLNSGQLEVLDLSMNPIDSQTIDTLRREYPKKKIITVGQAPKKSEATGGGGGR